MPQYRVVRTWTVTHEISVDAADVTEAELEARLARISYQYADAMVEERRKRQLAERKKDAPV